MACILKAPTNDSKGIIAFTTPERDLALSLDDRWKKEIEKIKDRWLVGIHHHAHDLFFKYDPLYDFHLAGETDLVEISGKKFPITNMDCCNFVPSYFNKSTNEKFWDILYVARAVRFKKIPDFFYAIRKLYDQGHMYRVLLISPIDEADSTRGRYAYSNIRGLYDEMFSKEEQKLFNFMTLNFNYPYPFDMPTLAHFYKSSKIFLHSADDERRCRVAAYGWAAGMPVVGGENVGLLLPKELQKPPYFYKAECYKDLARLAKDALDDYEKNPDMTAVRKVVAEDYTKDILINKLKEILPNEYINEDRSLYSLEHLDIRLGMHHLKGSTYASDNSNMYNMDFNGLFKYLQDRSNEDIKSDISRDEPEEFIAKLSEYSFQVEINKNHKYSLYQKKTNIIVKILLKLKHIKHYINKLKRCIFEY